MKEGGGDRRVIRAEDLDDGTLDAIIDAEACDDSKVLDALMDDS